MIKVLAVCCNFTWGGVEQVILNEIDNIDREKYQIDVLLPKDKYCDRVEALAERNVKVLRYDGNGITNKFKNFYKLLKNSDYDIIHFHTGHESALLCLAAKCAHVDKMIVHAHTTLTGDENTSLLHVQMKKLICFFSHIVYSVFSKKVACSKEAAKFMFGKRYNYCEIIFNGIDMNRFSRKDFNKFGKGICINARLDTQKNPVFVVDVISELCKIDDNIHLDWIGTGPLENEVRNRIAELKLDEHINLIGSTNEVENILKRNDFFLLPSLYEGLGICLIEAQAVGLKCFISDCIPDEANCGGCVKISLDKTAKEWANIIYSEMINSPEANIIEDKINTFNIKYTVHQFEELYSELAGEKQ